MKSIRMVANMPDLPQPFYMRDWKKVTRDYDCLAFNFNQKGDLMPLIWMDEACDTFGLPSYICSSEKKHGSHHESITCMASVAGASLAGVDKTTGEYDFVRMCECYFGEHDGVILNVPEKGGGRAGGSIWYDCYANITFTILNHLYPNHGRLPEYMRRSADSWCEAVTQLSCNHSYTPDFNFTGYRHSERRPYHNGTWIEPEGAAGVAWIMYMAHTAYGDVKYLDACRSCMKFLQENKRNPYYEILLPYGATVAARLNAEKGDSWDVDKILNWCFDGDSYCRPGWGVIDSRWGDFDCHGLVGSRTDSSLWGMQDVPEQVKADSAGYAFVTNTYSMVAALAPLCRYDKSYVRDIAKLILNTANASRLYYPGFHSRRSQSAGFFHSDPYDCIAYEGLRKRWDGVDCFATGDPQRYMWDSLDLGLYGSSHVGYLAGVADTTDVEGILRLDCLRTDFFAADAYPTFLYFNPHTDTRTVTVYTDGSRDLYDTVSETFFSYNSSGSTPITLAPGQAVQLVSVPSEGEYTRDGHRLLKNGIVVDYRIDMFPRTVKS